MIASPNVTIVIHTGQDGKVVQLHLHAPAHTILKWLFHLLLIHSFCTIMITFFTIAIIKSSVRQYSTFNILIFFHKVIFDFSSICYLLNTLKCSSNHSMSKALQVFLLFLHVTYTRLCAFVYQFFDANLF